VVAPPAVTVAHFMNPITAIQKKTTAFASLRASESGASGIVMAFSRNADRIHRNTHKGMEGRLRWVDTENLYWHTTPGPLSRQLHPAMSTESPALSRRRTSIFSWAYIQRSLQALIFTSDDSVKAKCLSFSMV
jgi:hypothetical protein